MSGTTVKLLQAAAEVAGGQKELAARLGIGETLLEKLMADVLELPDALLLRAVDIILTSRPPQAPSAGQAPEIQAVIGAAGAD